MSNLQEKIGIHDKYQFELKYTYPLNKELSENDYMVESFIFIPNNLGINQDTYNQHRFYSDTQKYIRFKTPVFLLSSIIKDKGPLNSLKTGMSALVNAPENAEIEKNYFYQLKMFCSILKSAFRDEENYIENYPLPAEKNILVKRLLNNISVIISEFRRLRIIIQIPYLNAKQTAFYNFSDEYISLITEKSLFKLLEYLKQSGKETDNPLCARVVEMIRGEIKYREDNNYPSIVRENSSNEESIYRMRILKKIMGSILFLKTNTQTEGRLVEQICMGFAAGLAMAFATSMFFLSRKLFADLTLSIFVILIVSYIFKDRIKELSKFYLIRYFKKYLYDYKTILMSNSSQIGFCRETFIFLKEKNLTPEIIKIRNKDYISELDNGYLGENVIYSKKYIKIFSKECRKLFSDFQVDGINDIIRFNVRHFLDKMDNPEKSLYLPEGHDRFQIVQASCVYHINIVLKYGMDDQKEYRKFRIVMNRDGIKRITEIPIQV